MTPFFVLTYDLGGNVTEITETYPGGLDSRTVTNSYDNINRLMSEQVASGGGTTTTSYTYDDANNRLTKSVNGGSTVNYTYNAINQLTGISGAESGTYTYDENGNRATKVVESGTDTYSYDYENRLVGLEKGIEGTGITTGTYAYAYDYRTRRILRDESSAGGASTQVVFSGGQSVQEYENSGTTPSVEYIRGSDYGGGVGGVLYTLRSGTNSYTHENRRGDVIAKTDNSGSLTYQAAYQAFGTRTQENGSTQDRQKANTKDEDPTGLLNEGFRYRDEFVFLTKDPAGFVDGPNLYTYVKQNPWTSFDPEGLFWETVARLVTEAAPKVAPVAPKAGGIAAGGASIVGSAVVIFIASETYNAVVYDAQGRPNPTHYFNPYDGPGAAGSMGGYFYSQDEEAYEKKQTKQKETLNQPDLNRTSQDWNDAHNAGSQRSDLTGQSQKETKTYITYVLKDANGEVRYVGRASGIGTPNEVMEQRIAKGHDILTENPGLKPQVIDTQTTEDANKGAEGVWYDYYKKQGANLLNDPKSPPLSEKPEKAEKSQQKKDAYIQEDVNTTKQTPN